MGINIVFLAIVFGFFVLGGDALRCKCTQSSNKAPCQDGVCDVNGGSCLMLKHPISGQLYACSSSPLPEATCSEKVTKSGANVKYCSCSSKDFCNFERWPDHENDDDDEDDSDGYSNYSPTTIKAILPFLLISFVVFTLMNL